MRPTVAIVACALAFAGQPVLALAPGAAGVAEQGAPPATFVRPLAAATGLRALERLERSGATVHGVLWNQGGVAGTLRGRLATSHGEVAPEQQAADFLREHRDLLGLPVDEDGFQHLATRRTLLGTTVRFQRSHRGVPVVPGSIVVHVDPQGTVTWYSGGFSASALPEAVHFSLGTEAAIAAALSDLAPEGALRAPPTARQVLSTRGGKAAPVTEVMIPASSPLGDWLFEVDGEGRVLSRSNRMVFARARVFLPNAVVKLENPGLKDQDDAASAVPAEAYDEVELQGLDSSGTLTGQFVSTELTADRAHSDTGEFLFDRSQKGFEEAMVYYHLDYAQRWFQSLGIDNANNRVQRVDVHGTTQDNSWYSPATKDLTFGDGGVDDAEDAEVVWHEYGHSTQDDQVPGWGGGGHARAMGEAFGDYLGGAISQRVNGFQLECVADWDGTSYSNANPPCLRRLDSTKHFPEDLEGEEHADGEIWSAALWQIHAGFSSPDDAARLVLAHHFLLGTGATMPEAAQGLLAADQQLYSGAHLGLIKSVMVARGILESSSQVTVSLRAGGAPVGGVAVLSGASEVTLEIPADTGSVTRLVAPGAYTLAIRAFGYLTPAPRSFEVAEDQTHEEAFELAVAPTGELAGHVRNQAGEGVAAQVRLVGVPVDPIQAGEDGAFSVQVPQGTYDLLVSAFGYKTASLAGISTPSSGLEVVLEPVPPILLVDDDGDEAYESYFEAALGDLGLGDQYMKKDGTSLQAAEDLLPFQTVIWLCGDRYDGIFPEGTQAAVRAYLAAGGRLVVSGQDIGYGLKGTPFYKEVLGAAFVKDTAGSKQVSGAGLTLELDGDSAANQKYPDVVTAEADATLWLQYGGTEGAAVSHSLGEGRVVYLGFGLEGVSGAEGRKALLGACLQAAESDAARRRGLAVDWFARTGARELR